MSITDELREWKGSISTRLQPETVLALRSELNCIADRIDAEHERRMADAELTAAPTEAQLSEWGYIELPKDADGVPIRVGDVLDGYGRAIEVVEMRHGRSGWLLISRDGNGYDDTFVFTHHHASTVEDVLREFTDAILEWAGKSGTVAEVGTWSDVAAEYAAKLRLAEEGV